MSPYYTGPQMMSDDPGWWQMTQRNYSPETLFHAISLSFELKGGANKLEQVIVCGWTWFEFRKLRPTLQGVECGRQCQCQCQLQFQLLRA
jgi:hypothetical protein